jgi:hypothetical protein
MRNLLAFLAAAILTFAAVGWYLNWYQVRAMPAPSGKHSFNINVDDKKFGDDLQEFKKKGEELLEKAKAANTDAQTKDKEEKVEPKKEDIVPGGK